MYGEIYRVLKPGALFVTYEWVTTKYFDAANENQQALIDEIVIGNGLPVRALGWGGSLLLRQQLGAVKQC